MCRARVYAAMHTLRVLTVIRGTVSSDGRLDTVRKQLEKGIVRRQAFETSGAVRKILQDYASALEFNTTQPTSHSRRSRQRRSIVMLLIALSSGSRWSSQA